MHFNLQQNVFILVAIIADKVNHIWAKKLLLYIQTLI